MATPETRHFRRRQLRMSYQVRQCTRHIVKQKTNTTKQCIQLHVCVSERAIKKKGATAAPSNMANLFFGVASTLAALGM